MADDLKENATESENLDEYDIEDATETRIEKLPKGSFFEEPNYEDKSPSTFKESLKKRWGEKKPKMKIMIVERIDRPK